MVGQDFIVGEYIAMVIKLLVVMKVHLYHTSNTSIEWLEQTNFLHCNKISDVINILYNICSTTGSFIISMSFLCMSTCSNNGFQSIDTKVLNEIYTERQSGRFYSFNIHLLALMFYGHCKV